MIKLKNAIISGIIMGLVCTLRIVTMRLLGYNPQNLEASNQSWLAYTFLFWL